MQFSVLDMVSCLQPATQIHSSCTLNGSVSQYIFRHSCKEEEDNGGRRQLLNCFCVVTQTHLRG
jgi:hypothetical protein